jgi:hypothetical protein
MTDRWSKLAPLTGVLFAVLVVAAIFSNSSETPKASASPAKVIAFYSVHRSEVETSAILFALAFLVLLLFAGALRSYLRRTPAVEGLSALVLGGGVLMAAGALTGSGVEYGLAHNLYQLSPATAQALNFLSQELFLPIIGGAFVLAVCSGLAILRGAALPKWLGWVAIVLGIAVIIPPASFPALLGFVIWSIVVSILMYLRMGVPADTSTPVPQSAV